MTKMNEDTVDKSSCEDMVLYRPGKRHTSVVWKYFGYAKTDGAITENGYPFCRACKKKIPATRGNTTNLFAHLRAHHRVLFHETQLQLRKKTPAPTATVSASFSHSVTKNCPAKSVPVVSMVEDKFSENRTSNDLCASTRSSEVKAKKVEKEYLPPHPVLMGSKQFQCSSNGCKLAFNNMQQLLQHSRVHSKPIQSLAGKRFHCSTFGCNDVLPSMQELLIHQKTHYKPNRYFKCENCMQRFRSHRSLFKHLHVCSEILARPSAQLMERNKKIPALTRGLEASVKPLLLDGLPRLQSVIIHPEKKAVFSNSDTITTAISATPIPLQPESSIDDYLPGLQNDLPKTENTPTIFPITSPVPQTFSPLETSLFGTSTLTRLSGEAHSPTSEPFIPYGERSPHNNSQTNVPHRLKPYLHSQGLPVSNAVWKKNQDYSVPLPSFHSKLTPPDLENAVIRRSDCAKEVH